MKTHAKLTFGTTKKDASLYQFCTIFLYFPSLIKSCSAPNTKFKIPFLTSSARHDNLSIIHGHH